MQQLKGDSQPKGAGLGAAITRLHTANPNTASGWTSSYVSQPRSRRGSRDNARDEIDLMQPAPQAVPARAFGSWTLAGNAAALPPIASGDAPAANPTASALRPPATANAALGDSARRWPAPLHSNVPTAESTHLGAQASLYADWEKVVSCVCNVR